VDALNRNRRLLEDFSSRTLGAIPSEYARLVYVSTLRDLATGRYEHAGLAVCYPEGAVHEALLESHAEIFARILEMPLATQLVDLRACLASLGEELRSQAARWRELEFYRVLVPTGVPPYIRELFCANLEALLSVVEKESAMAFEGA
jgi:hypothetical protein